MRQFLVWDKEGVEENEDTIMEDLFQAVDAGSDSESGSGDEDSAKKKKHKSKKSKKSKKRRSSSGSGDDDDDDDSKDSSGSSDNDAWMQHDLIAEPSNNDHRHPLARSFASHIHACIQRNELTNLITVINVFFSVCLGCFTLGTCNSFTNNLGQEKIEEKER